MKSALRILSLSLALLPVTHEAAVAQRRPSTPISTAEADLSSPVEIWGHERLAWDQASPDVESLADLTFTAYVDGLIDVLEDVRCSSMRNDFGFECSSRLPRMIPGAHAVEITATDRANNVSAKSAALNVVLRARSFDSAAPATSRPGSSLDAAQVVGGLVDVVDIAALPDGTVLIGEERGRILRTTPGKLATIAVDARTVDRSNSRIELRALAVPPDFAETRAVFVAYTTDHGLRLARFTEANGVLLNHAVLREVRAITSSAALAIGPDNKIYLALDDLVLRLNVDGSTPDDGPASGIFAIGARQPEKLTWDMAQRVLWLLGFSARGGSELQAIALDDRGLGRILGSYDLGSLVVTSLAILPDVAAGFSKLIVTPRDSSDLLQWRTANGVLDQATWLSGTLVERTAAMVEQSGSIWIASRAGLFRIAMPDR